MPSLRAPLNLLHALLLPHMLVPPRLISQGGIGLPRGPCHLSGHWVARHQSVVMSAARRRDTPCLVSSPGERVWYSGSGRLPEDGLSPAVCSAGHAGCTQHSRQGGGQAARITLTACRRETWATASGRPRGGCCADLGPDDAAGSPGAPPPAARGAEASGRRWPACLAGTPALGSGNWPAPEPAGKPTMH